MDNTTYEDLGDFHRNVTLSNPDAQVWINRGLVQLFAFNQADAVYCFKKAIELDKNCPFAYYGVSYASGHHYNLMAISKEQYDEAVKYSKLAQEKKDLANEVEKLLIESLLTRYETPIPEDSQQKHNFLRKYSDVMKSIHEKYPDDLDITGFYAESIMNLKPWQLWRKDGTPEPEALEAREVLDKAWKKGYHHLIAHLLIHLLELSSAVKDALPIADALFNNAKNVGHLLHMPSHIYIQFGDYEKSVKSNELARHADVHTFKRIGPNNFTTFYRAHNVQFLVWAAMFKGDYDLAIDSANYLNSDIIPESVILSNPEVLEFFNQTYLHVYIRFGKWDTILNLPEETRPEFKLTRAFRSYSRVLAYSVLGRIEEAEKELEVFKKYSNECPPKRRVGNNDAASILALCLNMSEGELLYRKKEYDVAFEKLRKAVEIYDSLVYCEPWDYMMPARHALAALLLENGRLDESIAVYQKDLATYPNNVWSLTGLSECFQKAGKLDEVEKIKPLLEASKKGAKEEIKASCFCKLINN